MPHTDDDTEPETDAGDAGADATTPTDAPVQPDATRAGRSLDTRTIGLAAIGAAVLVLAFLAGMAVNDRSDDRGARGDLAMQRGGPGAGGPGMQGDRGMRGGTRGGMHGDRGGRGGHGMLGARGGEHGGPGGAGPRGMRGGGGMGVVEEASKDELTIDPLRGSDDARLVVSIDDDTKLLTHGDSGPRDIEEIDASDIDEGDIVMVRGTASDDDDQDDDERTIDADVVMLLHAGE